jgi:ribonuclease BN (tRNA processing enzyme)
MKLVLLGTGGYHPTAQRHTACVVLPDVGVVLDAGSSTFRLPNHLVTKELDIFLSHAHLDHVIGLTFLLGLLWGRGMTRVTVYGDPPKLAAVREHLFAEALFPVPPGFEMLPLAPETPLKGGGRLRWFPLVHPGGCIGFRLDWSGHSLAYVTDTTANSESDYIEKIRGVDLLIHECNYPDGREADAKAQGHSTISAVCEVARRAQAGRLVLTHIDPTMKDSAPFNIPAARKIFPQIDLGYDGMEVEF